MPYLNINELSPNIKIILPLHAQHIYKAAFNSAYQEQLAINKSKKEAEFVAHKIAWSAVKHKYIREPRGQWQYKSN